jgi:hypothetical protein
MLFSFRTCTINFENRESALAAKHDLDSNPDIRVDLKWKVYPANKVDPENMVDPDNKVDPEKIAKQQEKLKRKIMKVEAKPKDPPKKNGNISITTSGTILHSMQNLNCVSRKARSV